MIYSTYTDIQELTLAPSKSHTRRNYKNMLCPVVDSREDASAASNFEIMATNNLTVSFVHLRNGAKANRNLSRHHDNVSENSDNGLLEVRHRN